MGVHFVYKNPRVGSCKKLAQEELVEVIRGLKDERKVVNPFLRATENLSAVYKVNRYWWSFPRTIIQQVQTRRGFHRIPFHIRYVALIVDADLRTEGLMAVSYRRKPRGSIYHYENHVAARKWEDKWRYPISYFGLPKKIRVNHID